MPARLRLYSTENIGRTAPFVLIISPRFPARLGRRRGAHGGVQRDWLLIHTHQLPVTNSGSSFTPLLHHQIHSRNRWFPLTLTFEASLGQAVIAGSRLVAT